MRDAMFLVPFGYSLLFFGQPLSNILIIVDPYFLYANPLK